MQSLFSSVITHLEEALGKLRTGRATPSLVEDLVVEHYGANMPLKQVATITAPEAGQILIQPWDATAVKAIVKAFETSNLSLNPVVAGTVLRINLPPLTQERREELSKIVWEKVEEAKVAVRNIREKKIKELKAKKQSEDITKREEKQLQEDVTATNDQLKAMGEKKEKEIMTL